MPTGFSLISEFGAYAYRWPPEARPADVPGMVATPQEAVRQAREHAAELARRRSPRALLEQLAGSSA
jgi:hypothetical protein